MNEATLELAKRAVASPHWRWLPGMLVMSDPEAVPRPYLMRLPELSPLRARVYSVQLGMWYGVGEYDVDNPDWEGEQCGGNDLPGTLPDLTDPATLGCLLALVRATLGEPLACVEVRAPGGLGCRACLRVPVGSEGWRVVQWWCASQDPTTAEASVLVAALERASAEVE